MDQLEQLAAKVSRAILVSQVLLEQPERLAQVVSLASQVNRVRKVPRAVLGRRASRVRLVRLVLLVSRGYADKLAHLVVADNQVPLVQVEAKVSM